MKRSLVSVLVLVFSALAIPLAGSPAVAAPRDENPEKEYWFGNPVVESMILGDTSAYTTAHLRHPEKAYAFPFHSTLRADLYDCNGKKARSFWGDSTTVKQPGKAWGTTLSASLNTPKRGKYSKWVLTVRSKGRKTTRITIDGEVGPFLTLGCKGENKYQRDRRTTAPFQGEVGRPLNAAFGKSPSEALKKHIKSFGTLRGTARVGRDVWLAGARTVKGGPYGCGFHQTYAWPGRPEMGLAEEGISCGDKYRVPKWIWFRSPKGRSVKTRAKGKHLMLRAYFPVRGHGYAKEFDLGRVK